MSTTPDTTVVTDASTAVPPTIPIPPLDLTDVSNELTELCFYIIGKRDKDKAKALFDLLTDQDKVGVTSPSDFILIDEKMILSGFSSVLTPIQQRRMVDLCSFMLDTGMMPNPRLKDSLYFSPKTLKQEKNKNSTSADSQQLTELAKQLFSAPSSFATGTPTTTSPRKSFVKLTIKELPVFSGKLEDWHPWREKARNILGQAEFTKFLDDESFARGNAPENQYLFYLIQAAIMNSDINHLSAAHANAMDGYGLWQAIEKWFLDVPGQKSSLSKIFKRRLENTFLDENTTVDHYVNEFLTIQTRMSLNGTPISESDLLDTFIEHIVDDTYRFLRKDLNKSTGPKTLRDAILELRRYELDEENAVDTLARSSGDSSKLSTSHKLRRTQTDPRTSDRSNSPKRSMLPQFPHWIMNDIPKDHHWMLWGWWHRVNKHGDDWSKCNAKFSKGENTEAPVKNRPTGSNTRRNRRGKRSKPSESSVSTPQQDPPPRGNGKSTPGKAVRRLVRLHREDILNAHVLESGAEKDESTPAKKPKTSNDVTAYSSSLEPRPLHRCRRGTVRSPSSHEAILIMDSAADCTLISVKSWHVFHYTGHRVHLSSRFSTGHDLEVVHAATTVTLDDASSYLLIVYNALLDPDGSQTESMLLPYHARDHGVLIDDVPCHQTRIDGQAGTQCVKIEDTILPLYYDGKMMYFCIHKPSAKELHSLPLLELTSPELPSHLEDDLQPAIHRNMKLSPTASNERWRRCLAWLPKDRIARTLSSTTQLINTVDAESRDRPRDHFLSRLHCLRPRRLRGHWYTDTFFVSVRSRRGNTCFQLFVGKNTKLIKAYPMRRESQAPNRYSDFVRHIGAPEMLKRDNSKTQTGDKWTSISRLAMVKESLTEPFHSNQNLAERYGGEVKSLVTQVLLVSGAPLEFWDFALEWVVIVLNHVSCPSRKDGASPMQLYTGDIVDISFLRFYFFEPILYYEKTLKCPKSNLLPGRFLGIAEDQGDAFTYRILTVPGDKSKPRIITKSVIRSRPVQTVPEGEALLPSSTVSHEEFLITSQSQINSPNVTADDLIAPSPVISIPTQPLKRKLDSNESNPRPAKRVIFDAADDPTATDVQPETPSASPSIEPPSPEPDDPSESDDEDSSIPDTPWSISEDIAQQLLSSEEKSEWFKDVHSIVGYRRVDGILELSLQFSPDNRVEWHLYSDVRSDLPGLLADYILANPLIDGDSNTGTLSRWARMFKRGLRRTIRRLERQLPENITPPDHLRELVLRRSTVRSNNKPSTSAKKRKSNGRNNRQTGNIKYGVRVPRSVKEAFELDIVNGDRKWQDAIEKEINALLLLDCFEFEDPTSFKIPDDYQYAPLRLVFDVKSDGRRKARLVAGGHVVDAEHVPTYASVVQGMSTRILNVLADRYKLKTLAGDVGNAFVNAYTNEKVYCTAGPEFGSRTGSIVIIKKALYGLKSSAERWHSMFADSLRELGFNPTRFDRDVWIKDAGEHYEYICTHVDDFCIFSKDPWVYMRKLQEVYQIKDPAPPKYYLGNDFEKLSTGHTAVSCSTYLKDAISRIERLLGPLKEYRSPMEAEDHPEDDESPLLATEELRLFQMLLGTAQWLVTIGRLDICFAVSSMARYNSVARQGHLQRMRRLFGYLKKYRDFKIVIDSRDPIITDDLPDLKLDWGSEYADENGLLAEELDSSHPPPKGEEFNPTFFIDADHGHDRKTRRSITGLIALLGCTPILWQSRRQGTIETSTYGAEFNALRTGTEEIIAMRYILRSLGVRVSKPTLVFGDNMSVILNSQNPTAQCKKKHNALAFHRVREATAKSIILPLKILSEDNYSDIFTKAIPATPFIGHVHELMYRPKRKE